MTNRNVRTSVRDSWCAALVVSGVLAETSAQDAGQSAPPGNTARGRRPARSDRNLGGGQRRLLGLRPSTPKDPFRYS